MTDMRMGFIDFMIRCEALIFGEFTLKSGRLAPYFVNTGRYDTGAKLAKLGEFYADCIINNKIDDKNRLVIGARAALSFDF